MTRTKPNLDLSTAQVSQQLKHSTLIQIVHTFCLLFCCFGTGQVYLYPITKYLYKPCLYLTHWGRVTYICVSKQTSIGSDNGLSPSRRLAVIWTNAGILLIGHLGTNFSEISIEIHIPSFKKMHLKMSSGKWRPFCLGLNVLTVPHLHGPWSHASDRWHTWRSVIKAQTCSLSPHFEANDMLLHQYFTFLLFKHSNQ